jgi:trimeric autotransporter adhesin
MPLRFKTMKREISGLLMIGVLFFSCSKEQVKPSTSTQSTSQTTTTTPTGGTGTTGTSGTTAATNSINGYMRLKLAEDSINTDGILINFKPTSKLIYVPGEDAPSMQGFGAVSLASLSSDNVSLAINSLPLTSTGATIGLVVSAKSDGIYTLNMQEINSVPDSYSVWLMDNYKKDSLEMRANPTYAFNIYNADTASFGSHRFKLVIRNIQE